MAKTPQAPKLRIGQPDQQAGYRRYDSVSIPEQMEYLIDGNPVVWADGHGWDEGWWLHIEKTVGKAMGLGPYSCLLHMNNVEMAEQWVKFIGHAVEAINSVNLASQVVTDALKGSK